MSGTLACIVWLILQATLIRTAPTTSSASTDPGTSLIHLSSVSPGFLNATSSLSDNFCLGSNSPRSDVETYRVAVPGTTTVLVIFYCPALPIDRNVVRETIATASIHMHDQLQIYGDRALLPRDDPYYTPDVEGADCRLKINSQRNPQTRTVPNRLTYQITLNALQGLFTFLYTDNHAASAVTEVLDPGLTGDMVRIGVVSISPLAGLVNAI
ncbi:MAG: hypothetical protein ALECFALPRED_003545 [Alectoria fallacina]|uniref:Uncharacterized protein n=1 Tax=Alectoria fallacina TaxID=1903189 RepID=A0A8H3ERI2_9LECA|nr:MAG: hypothetical protein ALECFALPRED_003545 [Alectoria fallacina]